jgi:hypothetical protein
LWGSCCGCGSHGAGLHAQGRPSAPADRGMVPCHWRCHALLHAVAAADAAAFGRWGLRIAVGTAAQARRPMPPSNNPGPGSAPGYGDLHFPGVLAECPRLRSRRSRRAASAACMAPGARGQRGVRSATATVALLPIAEPGKRPAPGRGPGRGPRWAQQFARACPGAAAITPFAAPSLSWLSPAPGFRDAPETPAIMYTLPARSIWVSSVKKLAWQGPPPNKHQRYLVQCDWLLSTHMMHSNCWQAKYSLRAALTTVMAG